MHKHLNHPLPLTVLVIIMAVITVNIVLTVTKQPDLTDGRQVKVRVDQSQVTAKVAADQASQAKGLMGAPALPETQGMLFVYQQRVVPSFWMKGVTFPIDIVWVTNDTVTEVTPNVPPAAAGTADEALPHYSPSGPVTRVLEVTAGWAAKHSIQPGDPVRITPF